MAVAELPGVLRGGDPAARAARGWRSRLAAAVVVGLVIQSITGLWLEVGAFDRWAEVQMLLHTVVGLLLVAPLVWYLVRHVRTWGSQRSTAESVLGWILAAATLVLVASGLVLTWQSWFGPRIGRWWHLAHWALGLGLPLVLLAHLVGAWRRRGQAGAPAEIRETIRAGAWTLSGRLVGAVAAAALLVIAVRAAIPEGMVATALPTGYSLPEYAQEFDEYRGSPFAPSFARTEHGGLIVGDTLAGSESCGTAGCHSEILQEWSPSAHRFSAINDPFQAVQKAFSVDRGPAETRYCGGCHDPISLFAGAKDLHNLELSAPGMVEGISCRACHSIAAVDRRGNADYVMVAPRPYLWEGQEGWRKQVSDFLIRSAPQRHLEDYDRPVLRTPEYCGACHKQFIPEALNRFGFVEGQNQFDEWRRSHWHSEEPEVDLSCRDCHMRLVESDDPSAGERNDRWREGDDRRHRHHGFIATNAFMAEVLQFPGWERHVELTEEWMRGETVIPEIAHLWPEGPVAALVVEAPAEVEREGEVLVRIVVQNRKAGHNFVTGPLDFVRSWIHLEALDANGTRLAEFGAIEPTTQEILDSGEDVHRLGNARDEGTLVLEAMPIDEHGEILDRHQLWRSAGGLGKRVIYPGTADAQSYRLRLRGDEVGPITIRAELRYRRYRQDFLELMVPTLATASGRIQRTTVQAKAETAIAIGG